MNFRTKKQIPMQFASEQRDVKRRKTGRPQDEEKNDAFLKVARFLQENDDEQITVVVVAGENAQASLHGGKPGEKLDGMRYQRYCEKLATNSPQIQPQNLPPTSAAARHHSLRVYLQVKQWKGENEGMSLEDYGWKGDARPGTPSDD